MTRLRDSVARALPVIGTADLSDDAVVEALLAETGTRRAMDLSDLSPAEQADLVANRAVTILPSADALRERIAAGRPLRVKLGIDPTSADVHLGHAVPMLVLSRFQRMGHHVILIIGDMTARIGDPSGRSTERPPLTDADIEANLATYADQVAPFFDFDRAELRHNSEWLAGVTLPELIGILSQVPVSMSLQRDDFRNRIAAGHGLAMSEFIYSVVMAIDSARIDADIELGGVDQLLNMQMGRRVMEILGMPAQLVSAMPMIEGTDGSGAKMSKSLGNYVGLTAGPDEMYGKIMSIPDRLTVPYLRAWSEWTNAEVDALTTRLDSGSAHPMDAKKLVAGETVAAIHGLPAAMAARTAFTARFSRRRFADVANLPSVRLAAAAEDSVGAVLTGTLGFTPSLSAARRIAKQNGLRVVLEDPAGEQEARGLDEAAVGRSLGEVVAEARGDRAVTVYLKAGRKVARVDEVVE